MSTIDLDAIKRDILRACGMGVRKPVLSIEQAESLLREVERLRGENRRLWTNTGVGGYAGDAPEEMYVSGFADHGCDAWTYLVRIEVIDGVVSEAFAEEIVAGHYTQPVRYVRADVSSALARVPPPAGQGEGK